MNSSIVDSNLVLKLFSHPISRVSQVMWKNEMLENDERVECGWPGVMPVFEFHFEDESRHCLLVASSDTKLLLKVVAGEDSSRAAEEFATDLNKSDYLEGKIIGSFDLDSVLCPVPGWESIYPTKCFVVESVTSREVLGICIDCNLGIKIGVFVSPNCGATLSFDNSCDIILNQALSAENKGLVSVRTAEYPGKETPMQLATIDWFDWLRNRS